MLLRVLVLMLALAMPATSYLAQSGRFGNTIESLSDRTPTLLVPAGYAFAIWLPIFLLAALFGVYQLAKARPRSDAIDALRLPLAATFALVGAWPLIFTLGYSWIAVAALFTSAVCVNFALFRAEPLSRLRGAAHWCTWPLLSVMSAWLSVAAFLNLAQTMLAKRVNFGFSEVQYSVALLLTIGLLLLTVQARIPRNVWYSATAIWAVLAIYLKQSGRALSAAHLCAWIALVLAVVLLGHFLWQLRKREAPSELLTRSESRSNRSRFR